MNVSIHGQNVKITDQLDEFTQKKVGKIDRYLPNVSEILVDVSREPVKRGGHQTTAQITVRHARGAILRAEERIIGDEGDTVKMAIQKATDKMYRQIERFKGKRKKDRRIVDKFERFIATEEEIEAAEDLPDYEQLAEEYAYDGEDAVIVRRKDVELMPMNEDEAIAQMELLGHTFFMFQHGETGEVNVIYQRGSGGYGLLVPLTSA